MRSSFHRAAIAVLASLLALAPASHVIGAAQAAGTASAESETGKRSDPNKRVCRTIKVTGSQIRQRVCHKQKDWDRMREEAQEAMRKGGPRVSDPGQQ